MSAMVTPASSPGPASRNQPSPMTRDLGRALTHGAELAIAMGIGVWLGTRAQHQWPQIAPWGIIGGFLLGACVLMRSLWRMLHEIEVPGDERAPDAPGDAP